MIDRPPRPVTSFIGRGEELRAIENELRHHWVVTLTGVGGSGMLAGRFLGLGRCECEEAPFSWDTTQFVRSAFVELESGADDEVSQGSGDEDLARPGEVADACADV